MDPYNFNFNQPMEDLPFEFDTEDLGEQEQQSTTHFVPMVSNRTLHHHHPAPQRFIPYEENVRHLDHQGLLLNRCEQNDYSFNERRNLIWNGEGHTSPIAENSSSVHRTNAAYEERFVNSDSILHNVHNNDEIEEQPFIGQVAEERHRISAFAPGVSSTAQYYNPAPQISTLNNQHFQYSDHSAQNNLFYNSERIARHAHPWISNVPYISGTFLNAQFYPSVPQRNVTCEGNNFEQIEHSFNQRHNFTPCHCGRILLNIQPLISIDRRVNENRFRVVPYSYMQHYPTASQRNMAQSEPYFYQNEPISNNEELERQTPVNESELIECDYGNESDVLSTTQESYQYHQSTHQNELETVISSEESEILSKKSESSQKEITPSSTKSSKNNKSVTENHRSSINKLRSSSEESRFESVRFRSSSEETRSLSNRVRHPTKRFKSQHNKCRSLSEKSTSFSEGSGYSQKKIMSSIQTSSKNNKSEPKKYRSFTKKLRSSSEGSRFEPQRLRSLSVDSRSLSERVRNPIKKFKNSSKRLNSRSKRTKAYRKRFRSSSEISESLSESFRILLRRLKSPSKRLRAVYEKPTSINSSLEKTAINSYENLAQHSKELNTTNRKRKYKKKSSHHLSQLSSDSNYCRKSLNSLKGKKSSRTKRHRHTSHHESSMSPKSQESSGSATRAKISEENNSTDTSSQVSSDSYNSRESLNSLKGKISSKTKRHRHTSHHESSKSLTCQESSDSITRAKVSEGNGSTDTSTQMPSGSNNRRKSLNSLKGKISSRMKRNRHKSLHESSMSPKSQESSGSATRAKISEENNSTYTSSQMPSGTNNRRKSLNSLKDKISSRMKRHRHTSHHESSKSPKCQESSDSTTHAKIREGNSSTDTSSQMPSGLNNHRKSLNSLKGKISSRMKRHRHKSHHESSKSPKCQVSSASSTREKISKGNCNTDTSSQVSSDSYNSRESLNSLKGKISSRTKRHRHTSHHVSSNSLTCQESSDSTTRAKISEGNGSTDNSTQMPSGSNNHRKSLNSLKGKISSRMKRLRHKSHHESSKSPKCQVSSASSTREKISEGNCNTDTLSQVASDSNHSRKSLNSLKGKINSRTKRYRHTSHHESSKSPKCQESSGSATRAKISEGKNSANISSQVSLKLKRSGPLDLISRGISNEDKSSIFSLPQMPLILTECKESSDVSNRIITNETNVNSQVSQQDSFMRINIDNIIDEDFSKPEWIDFSLLNMYTLNNNSPKM